MWTTDIDNCAKAWPTQGSMSVWVYSSSGKAVIKFILITQNSEPPVAHLIESVYASSSRRDLGSRSRIKMQMHSKQTKQSLSTTGICMNLKVAMKVTKFGAPTLKTEHLASVRRRAKSPDRNRSNHA